MFRLLNKTTVAIHFFLPQLRINSLVRLSLRPACHTSRFTQRWAATGLSFVSINGSLDRGCWSCIGDQAGEARPGTACLPFPGNKIGSYSFSLVCGHQPRLVSRTVRESPESRTHLGLIPSSTAGVFVTTRLLPEKPPTRQKLNCTTRTHPFAEGSPAPPSHSPKW